MNGDEALIAAALAAMTRAYAPYSRFQVGAAAMDETGAIHAGCNVENAAYPEGICAETAALAAMVLAGARQVRRVAIAAGSAGPVMPCGGCRQRLMELGGPDLEVISLGGAGEVRGRHRLGDLLPHAFGAAGVPSGAASPADPVGPVGAAARRRARGERGR
ncbi:MAG: cytidine deaminase [Hyphomicrobiaceae bacterium]